MKHKLSIEIHKNGSENENLTRLVANVNEGKADHISFTDIMGYLETRRGIFPSCSNYKWREDSNGLHISEDGGKSYTITLTWKEVYELAEVATSDDLKDINI